MTRFEIKMPKLGESITEGTILSWSVAVGDIIHEDDVLFEVNTAKVSAEIPSPVAGKVLEILFKEGDTVAVGTVVAVVDMDGGEEQEDTGSSAEKKEAKDDAPANDTPVEETPAKSAPAQDASKEQEAPKEQELPKAQIAKTEEERWYSPVVLQLAKEAEISREELDGVPGTGYEGRVSKKDIKQYIMQKKQGGEEGQKQGVGEAQKHPQDTGEPQRQEREAAAQKAAPSATPSTGTVTNQSPAPAPASTSPVPTSATSSSVPSSSPDGIETKEMDRVRRLIADHMVMSKHTSPHVTTVVEVDMTRLVAWREQQKEAFLRREGVKLTYMPLITEAVAHALAAYPQVNVSVEGYNILYKKAINIGIAVSQNDGNLIVPVVHHADRLSLSGLAVAIDSLANKARANKLIPDDITGGTFTITNFGTFRSLFGTPIINQPQVAILGVGVIEKKPAVIETPEGDVIAIRHKMYLSLSYDHRVVDGSLGGNFLYFIKRYLEKGEEG